VTILLEARDLRFAFARDRPVIDGFSAAFAAGTVSAVTGPSGRGKSTLLYLLGLMVVPQSGEVIVDGDPTGGWPDAARATTRAHRFGFVFQDAVLDRSRTVLDNVTEGALYRGQSRRPVERRARSLLDRFEVDVPQERRPGQVSGGQAQRVALCRALLANPAILLADEPTGNLDAASADMVVSGLRAHAESGAAVVIVTHDPSVVARCDRGIPL